MQAQTEILPRMSFADGNVPSADAEREELARQANSVLGYKKMAQVLTVPDALAYTLRELDIAPLVTSSVLSYKKSKERTGVWSGRIAGALLFPVVILLATATMLVGQYAIHCLTHLESISGWIFGLLGTIGLAMSTLAVGVLTLGKLFGNVGRGHRAIRNWERFGIQGYNGSVPEFALRKAVQIKTALPKVKLSIDALTIQREEDARNEPVVVQFLRDPFLVAELGTEIYYIDVWDEKEYERKM